LELMSALADPRARTLARWLMCSEWPECMDPDFRAVTEQELRTHLMRDKAAWTTVPSARREVARLLREVSTDRAHAILQDYVTNLDRIRRELACAPGPP